MVEQWGVKCDGTVSVATFVTSAVVEDCASYYVSSEIDLLLQATRSPRVWRWP